MSKMPVFSREIALLTAERIIPSCFSAVPVLCPPPPAFLCVRVCVCVRVWACVCGRVLDFSRMRSVLPRLALSRQAESHPPPRVLIGRARGLQHYHLRRALGQAVLVRRRQRRHRQQGCARRRGKSCGIVPYRPHRHHRRRPRRIGLFLEG